MRCIIEGGKHDGKCLELPYPPRKIYLPNRDGSVSLYEYKGDKYMIRVSGEVSALVYREVADGETGRGVVYKVRGGLYDN